MKVKPLQFQPGDTDASLHVEMSAAVQAFTDELNSDPRLSPYVAAYNAMFAAFDDTSARNMHLVGLCREMNALVVLNATKIQQALDYSSVGVASGRELLSEHNSAQKKLEAILEAEECSKLEIRELRARYDELKSQIRIQIENPRERAMALLQSEVEGHARTIASLQNQIATLSESDAAARAHIELLLDEEKRTALDSSDLDSTSALVAKESRALEVELASVELTQPEFERLAAETADKVANQTVTNEARVFVLKDLAIQATSMGLELEKFRSRATKPPRRLARLQSISAAREAQLSDIRAALEASTVEVAACLEKSDKLDQGRVAFQAELEQVLAIHDTGVEEKTRVKHIHKNLRAENAHQKIALAKMDVDQHADQRLYSVNSLKLAETDREVHEEGKAYEELLGREIILNSELSATKYAKIKLKEVAQLLREDIVLSETRHSDCRRDIEAAIGARREFDRQTEEAAQGLADVHDKMERLHHATERLRTERNSFQREVEKCQASQAAMQEGYVQVVHDIELRTAKIDALVKTTQVTTHAKDEALEALDWLKKMEKNARDGISTTDSAIRRIREQGRAMDRILEDQRHRMVHHEQEFAQVRADFHTTRNILYERTLHREQLTVESTTLTGYLNRSRQGFDGEMSKIANLHQQLHGEMVRMRSLEEKNAYLRSLQYLYLSLFQRHEIAQAQTLALYYESHKRASVPKLLITRAIYHEKSIQISLLWKLRSDIAYSEVTLKRLVETRDRMRLEVAAARDRQQRVLGLDKLENDIAAYLENIGYQDAEMKRLQVLIDQIQTSAHVQDGFAASARAEISRRRTVTATLRRTSASTARSTDKFLREPPVVARSAKILPPPLPPITRNQGDLFITANSSRPAVAPRLRTASFNIRVPEYPRTPRFARRFVH